MSIGIVHTVVLGITPQAFGTLQATITVARRQRRGKTYAGLIARHATASWRAWVVDADVGAFAQMWARSEAAAEVICVFEGTVAAACG